VQLKAAGALEENCGHRPVQYLNNVLEQDHRAIKRRVKASRVRLRQACLKAGIKDARVICAREKGAHRDNRHTASPRSVEV
jgi:transposase-like protein